MEYTRTIFKDNFQVGLDVWLSFLLLLEIMSSTISYWPQILHQSKRIETEIEKVQLLALRNLLKIQEEEEK